MTHDARSFKTKPLKPGAPLDLAEARNAVALARIAGADRYAPETFDRAQQLLTEAERAREQHRDGDAIMMPAREAAQTAEDARLIALDRAEGAFPARQQTVLIERESAALARARSEEERRREAEASWQAAEQARLAAERARSMAVDDRQAADAARPAAQPAKPDTQR